jgi:cobalt-zinc-cadmium efflux system outer membrane protein
MYRFIYVCVLMCWSTGSALAQTSTFNDFLRLVAQHHPHFNSLQSQLEANKTANLLNLTPDDPELGLNYLIPSPKLKAYRLDYQISQSFAFPTVYPRMKQLAGSENDVLDIQNVVAKNERLLDAALLQLEWIFQNQKAAILKERFETGKALYEAYQKATNLGEASVLERNRVRLFAAQLEKQMDLNTIDLQASAGRLLWMVGGKTTFTEVTLPAWGLPQRFEDWYEEQLSAAPEWQQFKDMERRDQALIKLNQAKWLPQIQLGYMREQDLEVEFRGATVGVSIPLWQQKNQIKFARSQYKATQEAKSMQYSELKQSFYQSWLKAQKLLQYSQEMRELLDQNPNQIGFRKALEEGEITLFEYLTEQSMRYDLEDQWLETQKEYFIQLIYLNRLNLIQ